MKLAAICRTNKRPNEVATAIECFLRQDQGLLGRFKAAKLRRWLDLANAELQEAAA